MTTRNPHLDPRLHTERGEIDHDAPQDDYDAAREAMRQDREDRDNWNRRAS